MEDLDYLDKNPLQSLQLSREKRERKEKKFAQNWEKKTRKEKTKLSELDPRFNLLPRKSTATTMRAKGTRVYNKLDKPHITEAK